MQEGESLLSGRRSFERQVVDFFCDGVKMLGLPKSVGEIYGLLFITPEALSLDDLVARLGISKGSASQGLRTLRELGAVRVAAGEDGARRMFYEPDVELKRLVGGFIKEQVRPHVRSGEEKLGQIKEAAAGLDDRERENFYADRIEKMERWSKRAKIVLPIIQKFLGS